MKPIDLLVPELFAADGGIQRYSRTLIRALRQIRPSQPLRVFIRNDHPCNLPRHGWDGIEWHPASGSNSRMAASLLRAACRSHPQLLFSTHPNFAPLQALHHALTGCPSWCSAHGIDVWSLPPGPKRWALGSLQRLLPVSHFSAERLQLQLGPQCPPLGLLPNCFDQQRFSPGPRPTGLLHRYGLRPEQPLILTLSRLCRSDGYKHLDALIRALPGLLPSWPDLLLMVAGDGDDRQRLQALAEQLGLAQQVIFTGQLPEEELADHYRLATVFALPSSGEGFGIVFLEALGCGRPVLAGNRDGSIDPLHNGRFGLLVDPFLPLAPGLHALLARQGVDLWFQPRFLAAAVGDRFGMGAFRERLAGQLKLLESP